MTPYPLFNLHSTITALLSGNGINKDISAFGHMTVISAMVCIIQNTQSNMRESAWFDTSRFKGEMRNALRIWESLWKRHKHASIIPKQKHGVLMCDAWSMLNSAYFRLYAGSRLASLKADCNAMDKSYGNHLEVGLFPSLTLDMPSASNDDILCVVKHASLGLLLRSKIGFHLIGKLGPLEFGPQTAFAGYEGTLILVSWLYEIHVAATPPTREAAALLALLQQVCAEMAEPPKRRPMYQTLLHRYARSLKAGWVYPCTIKLGEGLTKLESRSELLEQNTTS